MNALGKPVSNDIATNKKFRCLTREWKPNVTAIKEANDLLTFDTTILFGKLEEHEQELISLEKHKKKVKKEKNKEKEVEKKSIALVDFSSKSSTKDHDESGSSDNEKSDDEKIELFVKRYHNYMRRNRVKHSNNNLINFRRQVDSLRHDENKKGKSNSSWFNCGKPGH